MKNIEKILILHYIAPLIQTCLGQQQDICSSVCSIVCQFCIKNSELCPPVIPQDCKCTSSSDFSETKDPEQLFEKFMIDFEKKYQNDEEQKKKFEIFVENLKEVERHNSEGHTWTKGINEFSDLTDEEFKEIYLKRRTSILFYEGGKNRRRGVPIKAKLPKKVDWRTRGVITKLKNQGGCGSCWAFASVQQIESYVKINGGKLMELSTEQVTFCTPNPLSCGGTGGCKGSIEELAYSYVQLFGLAKASDLEYTGQDKPCPYNSSKTMPYATLRGYEVLPENDQKAIMLHLATKGPLAVSVAAADWNQYNGGLFQGCNYQSNIIMNHAVQLVGYGTDSKFGDYWLVRNSWGATWGEDGYIKLKRDPEPLCGLDTEPLAGSGCVGDGKVELTVCGPCGLLFNANYPIGAKGLD